MQMATLAWITHISITIKLKHRFLYVVWSIVILSFVPENKPVIHVEHILADHEFWSQCVSKQVHDLLRFVSFLNGWEDATQACIPPVRVLTLNFL